MEGEVRVEITVGREGGQKVDSRLFLSLIPEFADFFTE